jgi:acyl transferase domain-containing protein
MTAKTVFMFSGQGSQYYQMGKQLFDENPVFRHWMTRMDAMAHAYCGRRVVEAIYGSVKGEAFDQVLFTHPAIFMVEYALAQCLIDAGIEPDLTLGVSMGSFAAAAVGGHIGLGDALQAVLAQALAFQRSCPPGGMLAVLAPPALYDEAFMCQHSTMAGANFDGHFAVAGAPEDLALIETELAARAVTYQSLAVRYAFHSPAIDAAAPLFDACMAARTRSQGHIPLVCSGHASTLTHLPEDFFWRVVR